MRALSAANKLKALYRKEINFEISVFWDGGWYWKLGDSLNGYKSEGIGGYDSFEFAVSSLFIEAKKNYPERFRDAEKEVGKC